MPILEAGLAGLPVITTPVPAANELALEEAFVFTLNLDPLGLAEQMLNWAEMSAEHRLRVRVRRQYTWQAIYQRDILPLLQNETG
jgi:glycosyltransferase involved in cell wall biosynthesis